MNFNQQIQIWLRHARLTALLMSISIVVTLFSNYGDKYSWTHVLFISNYSHGLPEVLRGEVWRLLTPMFLHFDPMHIIFNMLWLFQLGMVIELRQGIKRLLILVLIAAILSNLSQYYVTGFRFGGMSGVVYALLGYVWAQGQFNPRAGMGLPRSIVVMMLIWFVVCWMGLVGNIANVAHTVGLLVGVLLGFLFSPKFQNILKNNQ